MASEKTAATTNRDQNSANPNSGETSFSDEILKLAQCLMPVAPTGKVKRVVDRATPEVPLNDVPLNEVAWKAYDSVVGLAKQTTDGVFSNASVGEVLGGTIDLMLRWQRFNTAVAGALFGAFWPAVGLPTGPEVAAVRADIRGIREMIRAAVVEADNNEGYARELHEAVRHSIVDGSSAYRARNSSSTRQVAVFTGWTGAEHTEISSDVSN